MHITSKHLWPIALIVGITLSGLMTMALLQEKLEDSKRAATESAPAKIIAVRSDIKGVKKLYMGSDSCQGCHSEEYAQWRTSDHFKAMQLPTSNTVLGDFSDVTVRYHGITTRFYQDNERYLVETPDRSGEPKNLEIKYTFGFHPLQQYLVELGDGHIQALNIAWDSRSKEEGGQQWFHLQAGEDIDIEHPFFWANHFQNWNSRCADCHSTNVQRNYSQESNSFATSFSEINVACEACHGPASLHVERASSDQLGKGTGFDQLLGEKLQWQFSADSDIAEPLGKSNHDDLNMCGRCHALRGQIAKAEPPQDFHASNRLQLLNENTYFADGQSKEESFVLGSFLQSKMYHRGVTCSNCHEPHSGKLVVEGNAVCAQCHKPQGFDTSTHHHHEEGGEGAQCVNCHMPDRAYMKIDKRRDHQFSIPRPDLSLILDVPNACTQCHQDKDDHWANQVTRSWNIKGGSDHWAHLLRRAGQNDVLVTRGIENAVLNTGLPEMVRASLLQHLAPMPSRVSADLARKSLYDKSPLVRRAAVAALQGQSAELRWQLLSPLLTDPNLAVRMEIAVTLADLTGQLPPEQQPGLSSLLNEYRESLMLSSDSVSTQLNIANLEMQLGNLKAVEQALNQALRIEPLFVPALLRLADFHRRSKRPNEERQLLEKALDIAPDSGAAQHSMGLFYVRQKNYNAALIHLKNAIEQADASPYYAYVYGVALENQGSLDAAIASLVAADKRWPNQYELLITLVLYLEKSGDPGAVLPYLSKLGAIAPGSPAVKELINKYQGKN